MLKIKYITVYKKNQLDFLTPCIDEEIDKLTNNIGD